MPDEKQRKLLAEANRHISAMLVHAANRHASGDVTSDSDEEFLGAARRLLATGLTAESAVALSIATSAAYIVALLESLGHDPVEQMEQFEVAFLRYA